MQQFARITIKDQRSQNKDQMSDEYENLKKDQEAGYEDIVKIKINLENRNKIANDFERFVRSENLRNMLKISDLLVQNNLRKKTDRMDYSFEILDVNKLNAFQDSYDEDDLLKIIQILEPNKHMDGRKVR